MSFFRFLPGADALSAFRQQRLLASLAAQGVELESIEAQYLHFIWSESDLDVKNQEILASLLTYGQPFVSKLKSGNSWFSKGSKLCEDAVVIPRFGTVSPWASKATDIARQCALNVLRIERGVQFAWQSKKELTQTQTNIVLAAIHDRMTEAVVDSTDQAQALYQTLADRPLLRIPVLTEGRVALDKANQELALLYLMMRFLTSQRILYV